MYVRCPTAVPAWKDRSKLNVPCRVGELSPSQILLTDGDFRGHAANPTLLGVPEYSPSASACQTSTRAFVSVAQSPERTT